MPDLELPPGWDYNPSAWRHRRPVLGLALVGFAIATYLTLYQLGVLGSVWEPFFGDGSRLLLKHSAIAHLLPIPDAALGAFAYLLEVVAEATGGRTRWRTQPWAVFGSAAVAGALAAGGILLVILQPLLSGTFCTLCLASATCSLLAAGPVLHEARACLQHRKAARRVSPNQGVLHHDDSKKS